MVTEGLPVECPSCIEDDSVSTRRPTSSSRSLNASDGPAAAANAVRANSPSSERESGSQRAALPNSRSQGPAPVVETPPESPRMIASQNPQTTHNPCRDSSYRKTYDDNDKKRAIPCENCALTLPRKIKDGLPSNTNGRIVSRGPILRTRKPYERVAIPIEASPPKSSNSSESAESDNAMPSNPKRHSRRISRELNRVRISPSNESFNSAIAHTHDLDYTSTHEPLTPTSFSIIRQSCLRTLSCETLPPNTNHAMTSSPTSPFVNSPFSSGASNSASTSGGPIFFGDPQAGYTTAYIFRIPDPTARGRRRVYALMALSTHHERVSMQTFSFVSSAFRDLAAWIQGLAEQEIERSENSNSLQSGDDKSVSSHSTPRSSFLSGRSRGPDGKFAGMSLRARGLAELVGLPDFFFELHARFVRLLVELSVLLGA